MICLICGCFMELESAATVAYLKLFCIGRKSQLQTCAAPELGQPASEACCEASARQPSTASSRIPGLTLPRSRPKAPGMLPLAADRLPATPNELCTAIRKDFANMASPPRR